MNNLETLEKKANNAMKKKFFLEATWIYYSMISLRLKELAIHLKKKPLKNKIKKISETVPIIVKYRKHFPKDVFNKDFSDELLKLKKDRDILTHDLVNRDIDHIDLEELAVRYQKAFTQLLEHYYEIKKI